MTTNLHQKILNKFQNSNIKIKSLDKLNEYITYCIDNNQNERILNEDGYSKSSLHHILPKAKDCFPEYKDLNINNWNGTHLLYKDHYYAHWLITEAIDSYSQLFAFCQMHNQDIKLDRITESDLIPTDKFQEKMEERARNHSEWFKNNPEKVNIISKKISQWYKDNPDVDLEAKEKRSRTVNSEEWKESVGKNAIEKYSKTMQEIDENGISKATIRAKKAAETMKVETESGKTIREIATEKSIQTRMYKYGQIGG